MRRGVGRRGGGARWFVPIVAASVCVLAPGCGRSTAGRGYRAPITPPERQVHSEVEQTAAAIGEGLRSPSHTMVISKFRKKIRVGMTTSELRGKLGLPRKKRRLILNPFTGRVEEWTYHRRVKFVDRPERDPEFLVVRIVVVIRDGRVATWHEM